jgi:hypothetical protein
MLCERTLKVLHRDKKVGMTRWSSHNVEATINDTIEALMRPGSIRRSIFIANMCSS